ncbi:MAG TPA: DUF1902 domain-containing protein [Candidatus Binatia bacterium]|nr:DUF1902 domain-containing protein [Candidatus Binatia bacterium]
MGWTSDDVPGLATEGETLEILQPKRAIMIPELLEANGAFANDDVRKVPMSLVAHCERLLTLGD